MSWLFSRSSLTWRVSEKSHRKSPLKSEYNPRLDDRSETLTNGHQAHVWVSGGNTGLCTLLSQMLVREGYRVTTLSSGGDLQRDLEALPQIETPCIGRCMPQPQNNIHIDSPLWPRPIAIVAAPEDAQTESTIMAIESLRNRGDTTSAIFITQTNSLELDATAQRLDATLLTLPVSWRQLCTAIRAESNPVREASARRPQSAWQLSVCPLDQSAA